MHGELMELNRTVMPAAVTALAVDVGRNPEVSVLVIDDDEFLRDTVSRQLQSLGIDRIVTAADGLQARQRLQECPPFSVVVSDLCLPGMDGVELLRVIAECQRQAALVLMSSKDQKVLSAASGVARARGLRVLGALGKPVTRTSLRAMLALLVESAPAAAGAPARASARLDIDPDAIRIALDRDEIVMHAQPKLVIASGELAGVEMLARWQSPLYGNVPPDLFIEVAERHGLMERLTEVVLRKSLGACRDWSREGLKTSVAVNFSAGALHHLDLPDVIGRLLAEVGVAPEQLVIEITETATIQNRLHTLDVLTRLRLQGIGLAIDDFGCGYATLQQLKEIPFTELKVDRSFVHAAATDAAARSIVENCIDLAHELGLIAVAEGVETRQDWDQVAALGCDVAQGYYLARPFAVDQLAPWLARR